MKAVTAIVHDSRVPIDKAPCAMSSRTFVVIERCCRPCPGASFDQRFTSGDVKGMPCGISEVIAEYRHAKPSSSAQSSRVSHHVSILTDFRGRPARRPRPARKSQVRELRADAVKVRRPRVSGVGAKRRTLYGVEHSSTLTNVTAGPVRARSEGRADLAVTRRRNQL